MKLKRFDLTVIGTRQYSQHVDSAVSFTENGAVRFNRGASETLELKQGDRLFFHQDEECRNVWFVEKTSDRNGYEVKFYRAGIQIQSAHLCKEVMKSVGHKKGSLRIMLNTSPKHLQGLTLFELKGSEAMHKAIIQL